MKILEEPMAESEVLWIQHKIYINKYITRKCTTQTIQHTCAKRSWNIFIRYFDDEETTKATIWRHDLGELNGVDDNASGIGYRT